MLGLTDIEFDTKLIHPTQDIDEVIRNCEIILVAAPSAYLKSFMSEMTESLEGKFILSATKGIIPDEYITITEYFNNTYGLPYSNLGVISGPSHAEEVSRDKLSYLTVACKNLENAQLIGEMFATKNLRISYSEDIYGYANYENATDYKKAYKEMMDKIQKLKREGLAAAVYTQLADVEEEVNGILTYDRKISKLD